MRAERRVANIRQIVLLLLLPFGITAANEVFGVFCRVRVVHKPQRLEPFVSDVSDLARLNVVPFPVLSFTLDSLRFF
jgi:hypothetical protein